MEKAEDVIVRKVQEIYGNVYPKRNPVRNPLLARDILRKEYKLIVSEDIITLTFASFIEGQPVLYEGPPGTGKTEIGEALLTLWSGRKSFVLPCSENYDEYRVIGDFHPLKAYKEGFTEDAFIPRPLLAALILDAGILIDEIRRSSEEFQNLLLDIVDKRRIIIPELKKVYAARGVGFQLIFTSNPDDLAQGELSDAFLRRVVRISFNYPPPEKEIEIIKLRVSETVQRIPDTVLLKVINVMKKLRETDLMYKPGISDSVKWIELAIRIASLRGNKVVTKEDLREAAYATLIKRREEEDIVQETIESILG
jgi:MoxR-like ATPase